MHRTITYLLLFIFTVLFQVFLFDNLSVSMYLNPLIYIAFVALLPLDESPLMTLAAALMMGITMDYTMGTAGLNVIVTLPVAYFRSTLLSLTYRQEDMREGGIPSVERMGMVAFLKYIIFFVLIHHTLFFLLEALSLSHLLHTVVRILVSSAVSVMFITITSRFFTSKLDTRV